MDFEIPTSQCNVSKMSSEPRASGKPIRVFLADNTRIHAQLLSDALARDPMLRVIGSACHSQEVIEAATAHALDVIILSSQLDEDPLRGLELLRKLRTLRPHVRAIVTMDSSKPEGALQAFRAGAKGVFSRQESLETLCKCVRQVHAGQIWANCEQIAAAVEALASSPAVHAVDANGLNLLSKRELEVVRSLAEGLSNREIAERLGLSQHTIKNYLFRVFDKLGVSSRVELLFLTLNQSGNGSLAQSFLPLQLDAKQLALPESFSWYERAAQQGIPSAQMALAQMYLEGKATKRNPSAAYMWYLISERTATEMKEQISAAKRKLAESLTTEEILEAQQKASEGPKKIPHAISTSDYGASARRI